MMRRLTGAEGAGRALRLGLLLLVVAGIVALLLAGVAAAAPTPTPEPSSSPSTTAPLDLWKKPTEPSSPQGTVPPGFSNKKIEERKKEAAKDEKARKRAAWNRQVHKFKEQHAQGGVLGAFTVTDQYGIPADAYEVSVDSGGITDFQQTIQAFLIEGMFSFTKWIIAFACWLITWALSWSLAAILLKPALAVSDALYNQAIVQLGLPSLLLAFSGTVAAWHLFFGNRSRGWGEIAASTLISALAVTTFAAPPQMLLSPDDGAVGEVRQLGLTVAALVLGQEDSLPGGAEPDIKALTRPISDKLVDAFIVKPSMLLTYDQSFSKDCAKPYSESRIEQALFNQEFDKAKKTVSDGINEGTITEKPGWAQSIDSFIIGKAIDAVKDQVVDIDPSEEFEKKCVTGDAGEAKKATWDKVGGALFVFIAAVLVFCLLLVLGCGYLVVQGLIALEAMVARVAITAGILPGPGRAWMWERGVAILRLIGALVAIVVGLAVFILVITSVLGAEKEDIPGGLTIRFVVVDLVCVAAFRYRKKIAAKGRAVTADMRTRLGSTRFGGRAPAQLDTGVGRRRSVLGRIARTGLLVGAMAASGGTSTAALGMARGGSGALGARLAARAARRGGRVAVRTTAATARAAGRVGTFGLQYTAGAPVYVPRAARRATAAARTMPARTRSGAQSLQQRLHGATGPNSRARNFAAEYFNNIGGRSALNRIRLHRGLPPIPPPHHTRPRGGGGRTGGGPVVGPRMAGAAPQPGAARRRTVPPRVPTPPASARQAGLQQRLHRARTRNNPPAPPPTASAPQPGPGLLPPPQRPAHPGRGSSGRGRRRRP